MSADFAKSLANLPGLVRGHEVGVILEHAPLNGLA
jgi:hypothetical protein